MKRFVFGNPHTSCWQLVVGSASRREGVVQLSGELRAGFFAAETPMCVTPSELNAFLVELEGLDRTLTGSAKLMCATAQSEVEWLLTALPRGYIKSSGLVRIGENELNFSFDTDQTQLGPLREWVKSALFVYANATSL